MLELDKAVFRIIAPNSEPPGKSGTAWFFAEDLLFTAAHCTGTKLAEEETTYELILKVAGCAPLRLELVARSWTLDVALLRLPDCPPSLRPIPLKLGRLPTYVPVGEPWHGRGFPRAHMDALHPRGSVSVVGGKVSEEDALEMHCIYGGVGQLEGISGGPVCMGSRFNERVVGIIRYAPPGTQQLVMHATALSQLAAKHFSNGQSPAALQVLQQIQELIEEVSLEPPPEPLDGTWEVQPPCASFTGREGQLTELREILQRQEERALQPSGQGLLPTPVVQAVCGPTGVGKTQLVRRYASAYSAEYHKIYWLDFKDPDAAQQRLKTLRRHIMRNPGAKPWLLIIDRAIPSTDLYNWIKELGEFGHVLVTTEDKDPSELGATQPVQLGRFTPDEALAFLQKRMGYDFHGVNAADAADAAALVEILKIPADLEFAAAEILKSSSFDAYREIAAQPGFSVLEKRISQCTKENPLVQPLLEGAALLGRDPIPLAFLQPLLPVAPSATPVKALHISDAAQTLRDASLVRYARNTITVDDDVRARIKDVMGDDRAKEWLRALIGAARAWFESSDVSEARCVPLVTHVRHLVLQTESYELPATETEALLAAAAAALQRLGLSGDALKILKSHADLKAKLFQQEETAMVRLLSDMAKVKHGLGQRAEAQADLQRALQLCQSREGDGDTLDQARGLYRMVLGCVPGLEYPEERIGALAGLVRVLCRQKQDLMAQDEIRKVASGAASGSPGGSPGGSLTPG